MSFRTPFHIVDRQPKPHKKLWPGVLKLHGMIANDTMREIQALAGIEKRTSREEGLLQRLLSKLNLKKVPK